MLKTLHESMNPLDKIHIQNEDENTTAQLRQHRVVLRIRQLTSERDRQGELSLDKGTELMVLQDEANENNWLYW